MNDKIKKGLMEMENKLTEYINKGRVVGFHEVRGEPVIAVKPDKSKIRPLAKIKKYEGNFLAVDCSTRDIEKGKQLGNLPNAGSVCFSGRTQCSLGL